MSRLTSSIVALVIGASAPLLGVHSAHAQDDEVEEPERAPEPVSGAEAAEPGAATDAPEPEVAESDVPEPEAAEGERSEPRPTDADAPLPAFDDSDPLARLTRPEDARNVAISERTAHGLLWIPRLLFAPLRFAIWLVTWPAAELVRLNERHDFVRRFLGLFVSDDGTYGVVPNFFLETGFGLNAGLRAFHKDLFGHGESIRARVGFGGYHQQHYQLTMASGNASSIIEVGGGIRYEVRENDRFFGIGNADLGDPAEGALPLSPYDRDVAVKTRYRHHTLIGELGLSLKLGEGMRIRASQQWEWSQLESGSPQPGVRWIGEVYDLDRLVAFSTQVHSYTELRFILNRQRSPHETTPSSIPSRGAFFQAWAGWQDGVRGDPSKFARVGFDMDGYINLYNDDRVLKIRTRYETVIGDSERIPFDHWAQLSGPDLLRGYSRGRFQARHAGVASLEYRYGIAQNASAFLFTDVGIIANRWEDGRPENWRIGYGGGLLFYYPQGSLLTLQIAASEEGVYVNFSFAPATAQRSIPRRMSP